MSDLPPILVLTPAAVERLKALYETDHKGQVLRLSVGTKGCSGHSYELDFVQAPEKLDETVEQDGVSLFIDRKAVLFLLGSTMDYRETDFESGFVFNNPNEKARCGCGESFYV